MSAEADQLLRNATSLLNRAHEAREVGTAAQVLTLIGRAADIVGWAWLLRDPAAEPERERLRSLARNDADMLGWASLSLPRPCTMTTPAAGGRAVRTVGLPGTGGHRDMDGPAVEESHLANIDNELIGAVTEGRLDSADRPAGIPPSHVWWFPSTP